MLKFGVFTEAMVIDCTAHRCRALGENLGRWMGGETAGVWMTRWDGLSTAERNVWIHTHAVACDARRVALSLSVAHWRWQRHRGGKVGDGSRPPTRECMFLCVLSGVLLFPVSVCLLSGPNGTVLLLFCEVAMPQ